MIHLRLQRLKTTPEYTEGELFVNGEWFAATLEDTVRKGKKVYGKTAIPAGTYKVAVTFSNRFKREMTEIQDVPGFSGVRIHQGTKPEDSAGCPLISKRRGVEGGNLAAMKAGILTNQLTEMVKSANGGEIVILNG